MNSDVDQRGSTQDVALPSGATLKITISPFLIANALFQATLEETKAMDISASTDVVSMVKEIFCASFSSQKMHKALQECMKRALYNDKRIDADTFEPIEAREDYLTVCAEVALANLRPFTKHLASELKRISETLQSAPASK